VILPPLVFTVSSLIGGAVEPQPREALGGGAEREHLGEPKMVQEVAKVEP
jgi:hypothetical protein